VIVVLEMLVVLAPVGVLGMARVLAVLAGEVLLEGKGFDFARQFDR
jgi:hypothetical protein